jgi:hypothetical protein
MRELNRCRGRRVGCVLAAPRQSLPAVAGAPSSLRPCSCQRRTLNSPSRRKPWRRRINYPRSSAAVFQKASGVALLCVVPYEGLPRGCPNQPARRKGLMKFVSLRTRRAHSQGKLDKPSRATDESFARPTPLRHQIHTYVELRQQIHDDLRIQHPEWVEPDGKSPMCDSYEARLVALLDSLTRSESTHAIVDPHRLLEWGTN